MSTGLGGISTHRARKQHRCVWCGEPIEVGTRHLVSVVLDDDRRFSRNRYHPECLWACHMDLEDSGEDTFMPHMHHRGCWCGEETPCSCRSDDRCERWLATLSTSEMSST